MKKITYSIALALVVMIVPSVFAANNEMVSSDDQQTQKQLKTQSPIVKTDSNPILNENQVQNNNQITTKNQGVDTQLQIANQEMEQLMEMNADNQVFGNQVKAIVQEQEQAQVQIQVELNKFETKSNFLKRLFGTDYGAVKNLNNQVEQNRLRIQQLTELQNQVTNKADGTQLQEVIQALTVQNISLQQQIETEESISSLFGWLVKLFYK